ncbi:hypothetical protein [Salinibius halmophilus]|uniref:hypothetical protein n=1 Tax=Salinibius halmophilus TaxID=1853216 RepID=UPI000E669DA9|nr:hypothetical protein [Salinibius halmophilus]
MKWIVYVLLAVNLAYFASQTLLGGKSSTPATAGVQASIAQDSLVQRVERSAPERSVPAATPSIDATSSNASSNAGDEQCTFISRVAGAPGELRIWLQEQGIEAEFIEIESVIGTDFLVVMPPLESYEAAVAMRSALSERGFDSFLMVDDYENGLSLGFFSQKNNAINYIARLDNNGFKAELLEKEKRATVAWLKLTASEAVEYRRVAATAQQKFGQINLQRNSCQSVAF